jgi:hypothetical protein
MKEKIISFLGLVVLLCLCSLLTRAADQPIITGPKLVGFWTNLPLVVVIYDPKIPLSAPTSITHYRDGVGFLARYQGYFYLVTCRHTMTKFSEREDRLFYASLDTNLPIVVEGEPIRSTGGSPLWHEQKEPPIEDIVALPLSKPPSPELSFFDMDGIASCNPPVQGESIALLAVSLPGSASFRPPLAPTWSFGLVTNYSPAANSGRTSNMVFTTAMSLPGNSGGLVVRVRPNRYPAGIVSGDEIRPEVLDLVSINSGIITPEGVLPEIEYGTSIQALLNILKSIPERSPK